MSKWKVMRWKVMRWKVMRWKVASELVFSGSNLNLKGKEIKQIELIFNIVHLLLSMSHT